MAKKSMPVYFTEQQYEELKKLYEKKYQHMSFSGMFVDIAIREARKENK